jgi:ElaB/YqjD/DUF883 family membrane-anchored ribosome-binding protein
MSATPGLDENRDDRREPEDLQREADAIRADMDRTLNALERKLSPRQLLDRSLTYMQENGGDVLQKIGATVNKHPLPLLLTSAGLIWLAAASRSSSRRRWDTPSTAPRTGDFDATSQSFSSSSSSSQVGSGLKARASRTLDATRQRASRTLGATRERTQELGQNLNGLIREQPLVCGAVALAVGAIVGAAFPASAYERNLVARARAAGESMLDEAKAATNNDTTGTTGTSTGTTGAQGNTGGGTEIPVTAH